MRQEDTAKGRGTKVDAARDGERTRSARPDPGSTVSSPISSEEVERCQAHETLLAIVDRLDDD